MRHALIAAQLLGQAQAALEPEADEPRRKPATPATASGTC